VALEGLVADGLELLLLLAEILELLPVGVQVLLLGLQLLALLGEGVVFALEFADLAFVLRDLAQQLSVGGFLVEELLDEFFSVGYSGGRLDVFEGDFHSVELQHFSGHLVPQEALHKTVAKVDLVPVLLLGILVL
jgi:hypothetical protein